MTKSTSFNVSGQSGCLILFGLFWTAFSSIFLIIGIVEGQWLFALVGGLFVLIGLGLMSYSLLSYYTRLRVGKPEIAVTETTLRPGESFTMTYVHTFRRSIQVEELLVQLIFRETATYQQGTDTRTVVHNETITEFREPGRAYQSGNLISKAYDFQIPPDGMHSLEVRRNKLEWFLRMQMTVPRLPDFVEQIELDVLPELM